MVKSGGEEEAMRKATISIIRYNISNEKRIKEIESSMYPRVDSEMTMEKNYRFFGTEHNIRSFPMIFCAIEDEI